MAARRAPHGDADRKHRDVTSWSPWSSSALSLVCPKHRVINSLSPSPWGLQSSMVPP